MSFNNESPTNLRGFYFEHDEFNTLILSNLTAWKIKETSPTVALATCCFPNYRCLYSYFDKVFEFPWNDSENPVDVSVNDVLIRSAYAKTAREIFQNESIPLLEIPVGVQNLIDRPSESIHKVVFKLLAEHMSKVGALIQSSEKDRESVKQFLERNSISEEYVVIIGRNRQVHKQHNNLLRETIGEQLNLGKIVINATYPNPNLKAQYPESYFELGHELQAYGITVALMEKASMSYCFGNAGGVSLHMMTSAPLTIVGEMEYVHRRDFRFQGKTLFEARFSSGLETHHSWRDTSLRNRIKYAVKKLLRLI
jgi:hypothetical protein